MNKKKIIAVVALLAVCCGSLCACGNKDMWDTVYTFDEAIVRLADDTIVRGKVQSWKDYEDGDQVQVKIDGVTYLVHSTDCSLIAK